MGRRTKGYRYSGKWRKLTVVFSGVLKSITNPNFTDKLNNVLRIHSAHVKARKEITVKSFTEEN